MSKTTEFDPASYLDSEALIAEYLNIALAVATPTCCWPPLVTWPKPEAWPKLLGTVGWGVRASTRL